MLFRRDRVYRECGGVAVYVRQLMKASRYKPPIVGDEVSHELLWIKSEQGSDVTFIGALYHSPATFYQTNNLPDYIEATISRIQLDFTGAHIILVGDLNQLSDTEVNVRTSMSSIDTQLTRGSNKLDRVYASDHDYGDIKVVMSIVKSDHMAIIAYSGELVKAIGKTRRVCKFQKHTAAQHTNFL